jgi:hypothetical protein
MSFVRVGIAVDDESLERVEEVVRACRALGFRGDSTLTGVGVFTGTIAAENVAALRALPGVAAVEIERNVRIRRPLRH